MSVLFPTVLASSYSEISSVSDRKKSLTFQALVDIVYQHSNQEVKNSNKSDMVSCSHGAYASKNCSIYCVFGGDLEKHLLFSLKIQRKQVVFLIVFFKIFV